MNKTVADFRDANDTSDPCMKLVNVVSQDIARHLVDANADGVALLREIRATESTNIVCMSAVMQLMLSVCDSWVKENEESLSGFDKYELRSVFFGALTKLMLNAMVLSDKKDADDDESA